jgi:hypothetical protein
MSRSVHRLLSKNKAAVGVGIGAIAMLAMAVPALTQPSEGPNKDEVFTLTTAIGVPAQTSVNPAGTFFSFDISWFDPVLNRYFLADRNNKTIDVVDPTNNSITQFFNSGFAGPAGGDNDHAGPDGVVTVHTAGGVTELWVGDSPGKVWVLNASTGANILGTGNFINVGGTARADELCFDPQNHVIMIASPGEESSPGVPAPFVTFISTTTHKVLSRLVFNGTTGPQPSMLGWPINGAGINATGGLEQCQWSAKTGQLYQNVPVNGAGPGGAVAVIDGKTMKVEKTFPVPNEDCNLPQGMAIGPQNQILLGCNGPSPSGHRNSIIINGNSGAVLAVLPDLGGADEVWFNASDGHYFIPNCNTACRAAPPTTGQELLGVVDSRGFRLDQTVVIADKSTSTATGGSRRIHSAAAADPNENHGVQVYVPIPAIGGGTPIFNPTLCSSAPTKVGTPTDANGCIAVFSTKNDDRSSVAQERGMDDHQQ